MWQRTSWEATKTELELAVDVSKNKCKVLHWMAGNNNTVYMTQATHTKSLSIWHKLTEKPLQGYKHVMIHLINFTWRNNSSTLSPEQCLGWALKSMYSNSQALINSAAQKWSGWPDSKQAIFISHVINWFCNHNSSFQKMIFKIYLV